MKINVLHVLKDFDGTDMEWADEACSECGRSRESQPFTVRLACTSSLVAIYRDEDNIKGDEKVKRYNLAMRIYENDEVELTVQENKIVQDMVAKRFGPMVVGQVWKLLEKGSE